MNISAEGAIGATVNEGGPAGSDGAVGDDEPLQPAGKDVSRHRTAAAMKVRIVLPAVSGWETTTDRCVVV